MVVVTQRQTPQVSTGYKEVWKVAVHMKGGQEMDGGGGSVIKATGSVIECDA
jgi:hypothetical protein